MEIILASQSPRRKELLALFGFPYTVRSSDIDEGMDPQIAPEEEVRRVSRLKALAANRSPEDVVIAADTIVVCDDAVLGKPRDPEDAKRMLRLLSGREHQVMTGLTVLRGDACISHTEITQIRFRELSEKEINRYVQSGEPMDKAGAYGIQGGAAVFVEAISGDYFNVVGLPVCRLHRILSQLIPEYIGQTMEEFQ